MVANVIANIRRTDMTHQEEDANVTPLLIHISLFCLRSWKLSFRILYTVNQLESEKVSVVIEEY